MNTCLEAFPSALEAFPSARQLLEGCTQSDGSASVLADFDLDVVAALDRLHLTKVEAAEVHQPFLEGVGELVADVQSRNSELEE